MSKRMSGLEIRNLNIHQHYLKLLVRIKQGKKMHDKEVRIYNTVSLNVRFSRKRESKVSGQTLLIFVPKHDFSIFR